MKNGKTVHAVVASTRNINTEKNTICYVTLHHTPITSQLLLEKSGAAIDTTLPQALPLEEQEKELPELPPPANRSKYYTSMFRDSSLDYGWVL